jgi:hypothetical protein
VYGQLVQVFTVKLARATPANMRIQLQRLFTVTFFALVTGTPRIGQHLVQSGFIHIRHIDLGTTDLKLSEG